MTGNSKNTHSKMPPKMVKRKWKTRKGWRYAYYYEYPRDAFGKRNLVPLGTDFSNAKLKWGEIEGVKVNKYVEHTLGAIYNEYIAWAENLSISKLSPRTIKDRKNYWKQLEPVFGNINMDSFKPLWCVKYFEQRSSQISAKKELKFLSVLFNWALGRELCSAGNPYIPISHQLKVKENRDILITLAEFKAVKSKAVPFVQDLMDLMYMAGTRPEEALYIKFSDIQGDELAYEMRKVKRSDQRRKIKRVRISPSLKKLIDRRRTLLHSQKVTLIDPPLLFDDKGKPLTLGGSVKNYWKQARDAAEMPRRYQLKDIRPYAATEHFKKAGMESTRKFLGHNTEAQTLKYIRDYLGEETESHDSLEG